MTTLQLVSQLSRGVVSTVCSLLLTPGAGDIGRTGDDDYDGPLPSLHTTTKSNLTNQ